MIKRNFTEISKVTLVKEIDHLEFEKGDSETIYDI